MKKMAQMSHLLESPKMIFFSVFIMLIPIALLIHIADNKSAISKNGNFKFCLPSMRNVDTLLLDDGTAFDQLGISYCAQRFSPGVLCTLESIIWRTHMSEIECSLFVWPDSSGVPKSSSPLLPPLYYYDSTPDEWQKIDLPTPLAISTDFWIGITSLGITYSYFYYDYTPNSHNRVARSVDKVNWNVYSFHIWGELLVRPVVELTGPRHDVSCVNLFSRKALILPNPPLDTMGVVIRNFGNVTETNLPIYLRVIDSTGVVVFFDFAEVDSLQSDEIDTVFIAWNYLTDGDFIIEGYPWIFNDCVPENDRLEIESYIRTYPCELYYDNAQTSMGAFVIDSLANKYIPPYYPCKIESARFYFDAWPSGTTYTFGVVAAILDDDGVGGLPGTEIAKDSLLGLGPGEWWLTIDLSNQNAIFDSGAFYVEWIVLPDSTTPLDQIGLWCDWWNPFFCNMTWFRSGGIWEHWMERADPVIRAFVDYPSFISENHDEHGLINSLSANPTVTNGKLKCSFRIEKDGAIDISCYSIDGRKMRTLLRRRVKKGIQSIFPDLRDLPQGVYFIRMEAEGFSDCKKITLLK
jgi:hypothetical protein